MQFVFAKALVSRCQQNIVMLEKKCSAVITPGGQIWTAMQLTPGGHYHHFSIFALSQIQL